MNKLYRLLTWVVGAILLVLPALAADPLPGAADEQALREANLASDGASLLDFLRKQTLVAANRDKLKELIRRLGDDSFEAREKASADLVAVGRVALPLLEQALKDPDLEVARRSEKCIELIRQKSHVSPTAAVVRLLARKRPAGAAEALLDYLPYAESAAAIEEVRTALVAVALRDGQVDPVLKEALSDKMALRRGAAAEALCRAGALDQRPALLRLLKDPDPTVRLRLALALAYAREKEAVPVLIELLGILPPDQLWPVEDVLLRLADDQAPADGLGGDDAARKKCRDAWAAWWRAHEAGIDLAKLTDTPKLLGYTLVVLLDQGVVIDLDENNKPRWQIEGLDFPLDVQLLPREHILVAEQNGGRVTERNRKGAIVWEKKIDTPLMAQRLPNGNTFIATRNQLLEVDPAGKEIYSYVFPNGDSIMRALKLRNGDVACVTAAQQFVRLDPKGKELKRFPVSVNTSGGRIDVLPNGHVLIPQMSDNKVVEYDADGRAVWQASVEQPIVASRLPTGNTLVTSMSGKRAVEVDRAGKEVWEYRSDSRVTRALRR